MWHGDPNRSLNFGYMTEEERNRRLDNYHHVMRNAIADGYSPESFLIRHCQKQIARLNRPGPLLMMY